MAYPWFPVEIYTHILSFLPLSDPSEASDVGALTLARCAHTNSILRVAATLPALWEPHYRARYTRHRPVQEAERLAAAAGDWRRMYATRAMLDRRARELLSAAAATAERSPRLCCAHATAIVTEVGCDAWSALAREAAAPLSAAVRGADDGAAGADLTRRFWAGEVLGVIARCEAVERWPRLGVLPAPDVTFEEVITGLSAFWGIPSAEISERFDALTILCRVYLQEEKVVYDAASPDFHIPKLCVAICSFMRAQGYDAAEDGHFHDLHNNFPHFFLTTHKKTLPISLVCIFVAIARRLGITAFPVGTPSRVLAIVPSLNPDLADTYVDVFGSATHPILSLVNDLIPMLLRTGISPGAMHEWIAPAPPNAMLIRATHNIYGSLRLAPAVGGMSLRQHQHTAQYAASCAAVLVSSNQHLLGQVVNCARHHPLDAAVVVRDAVVPRLDANAGALLQQLCEELAEFEMEARRRQKTRQRRSLTPVRFFVGQLFLHRKYSYIGCIIAWTPTCEASEGWMAEMRVDELPRGRMQPFYSALELGGPTRLVAEENIEPLKSPSGLFEEFVTRSPIVGKFFRDAEVEPGAHDAPRRGRFLMNGETKEVFPADDEYGARWIATGELGVAD